MKAKIERKRINISLPLLRNPRRSKSGKTLLVATTRGPRRCGLTVNGQAVHIIVNAYVRVHGHQQEKQTPTAKHGGRTKAKRRQGR